MQVSELFALTSWVADEIESEELANKYRTLYQVLFSNTQPNTADQPFERPRAALLEALRSVPLDQLTNEQREFLRCLGVLEHLGEAGAARVEDVLYKNALDSATAAKHMNEAVEAIEAAIERSDQLRENLDGCVATEAVVKDRVMVRVSFQGNASVTNVVELRRWIQKWYEISRGVAMVHDSSPESVAVVGASRGSLIVELAVDPGLATTIGLIVWAGLEVSERVLRIRKQAAECRRLELENAGIANQLEEEAAQEKRLGKERITERVRVKLEIEAEGDGEKLNALTKSVGHLVDFMDKGGHVDLLLPEEVEPEDEEGVEEEEQHRVRREQLEQVTDLSRQIRKAEQDLRLLGSGDDAPDDAS